VTRLRSQLDALVDKHQQATGNRDNLLARHRRAQAQQQVSNTMRDLDITDYSGELARMERRIRQSEARASAETELNSDMMDDDTVSVFDDMERETKVDSDLAALKARLGMSDGGSSGGSSGGSETRGETVNFGGSQGNQGS
jgi:phage shock protein A